MISRLKLRCFQFCDFELRNNIFQMTLVLKRRNARLRNFHHSFGNLKNLNKSLYDFQKNEISLVEKRRGAT